MPTASGRTTGSPSSSRAGRAEPPSGVCQTAAVRAITVEPGRSDSAGLAEIDEPDAADGSLLVSGRLIGVCGTDHEIVEGTYGEAPDGQAHLVLGHEGFGEVLDAPPRVALRARRPGRRDRAPARPRALPRLRRG